MLSTVLEFCFWMRGLNQNLGKQFLTFVRFVVEASWTLFVSVLWVVRSETNYFFNFFLIIKFIIIHIYHCHNVHIYHHIISYHMGITPTTPTFITYIIIIIILKAHQHHKLFYSLFQLSSCVYLILHIDISTHL